MSHSIINKKKDLKKLPTKVLTAAQTVLGTLGDNLRESHKVRSLKKPNALVIELPTYYRMVRLEGSEGWLIVSHNEYSQLTSASSVRKFA